MSRREEIKKIIQEKEIKVLLHFTQLQNLPSILKNGLQPRDDLDGNAKWNDELRLDNHTDTISLSIQHPNDAMFFKYRQTNLKADWCILALSPKILIEEDVLFCFRNAASTEITCLSETTLSKASSFERMFEEIPNFASREEQCLRSSDPTDVQAEVLVKGTISPEKIIGIVFTSRQAKKEYQHLIGERKTKIHSENVTYLSRRDIQRKFK